MSTRPVVSAEPREVVGKKVSNLRREGILPAVVYGGHSTLPVIVAALHEDPEQAERALDLIEADWQTPAPHVDETSIWDYLRSKDPGGEPEDVRGTVEEGAKRSDQRFSRTLEISATESTPGRVSRCGRHFGQES